MERRLAALIHADVVGYSRLMAADESLAVSGVRELQGLVEGIVRQHRGRLVDFTGDAFLAEFPSAVDATSAAFAIQRENEARGTDTSEDRRLRLRIGVHAGEVRAEGEQIYGDAIHVAARLQTLADPGGVCISGALHEQLAGKLAVRVRDLGPQTLKNLARPVRALEVSLDAAAAGDEPTPVPGFSGRPAIAVLAFAPFSGEPEQEYLGDGIAEDLITRLATHREFPVIARNSSFAYKGRSVDVKQIGRELGIAYLIEGSVRRAGTRVRVTAQLVDVRTGHHVWAERYDRELADVFAIQDEIVDAVVARVYPELMRAERDRVRQRDPASLDAWECVVLGRWHAAQWVPESSTRARELAERALALDPGCADALRILQMVQIRARLILSANYDLIEESIFVERARRALEISGDSAAGWLALGFSLSMVGDFDAGIAALQRALALNPSSEEALIALANTLTRADRAHEALPLLENAERLDPIPADVYFRQFSFAFAYWAMGRFEDSAQRAEMVVSRIDTHVGALRILIASRVELERLDDARVTAAQLMRVSPSFRISLLAEILPYQPALLPRLSAALRKAGLPE